jgi:hypothetical protein
MQTASNPARRSLIASSSITSRVLPRPWISATPSTGAPARPASSGWDMNLSVMAHHKP